MKAIVLADFCWGISKNKKQICYISEDLKKFRRLTERNVILYGRKTLKSFPKEKPLPNRINICMSHTLQSTPSMIVMKTIEEALEYEKNSNKDVFVVGGASIYKQFYPYIDTVYVTKILDNFYADQFFPAIDIDDRFELVSKSAEYFDLKNKVYYRYELFKRGDF